MASIFPSLPRMLAALEGRGRYFLFNNSQRQDNRSQTGVDGWPNTSYKVNPRGPDLPQCWARNWLQQSLQLERGTIIRV